MPRHIAIGKNFQSGTLVFNNAKLAIVTFDLSFKKVPRIALTFNDTSTSVPYTTNVSKTGFTVNLQNKYTGSIEWTATERE